MDSSLIELISSGGLSEFSAVVTEKCKEESFSLLKEGEIGAAEMYAKLPEMLNRIINTLEIDIKKEMSDE